MKERILKLLKEPSSYAGLAAALGGAAVLNLSTDMWMTVFGAVAAVAGAVAVFVLDPSDK